MASPNLARLARQLDEALSQLNACRDLVARARVEMENKARTDPDIRKSSKIGRAIEDVEHAERGLIDVTSNLSQAMKYAVPPQR